MLMTVKLNLHDWPKRGAFQRNEVDVEADSDSEAIALGLIAGQQKWPGAKVKAYDVVKSRLMETTALVEPIRRGPGRPRKSA